MTLITSFLRNHKCPKLSSTWEARSLILKSNRDCKLTIPLLRNICNPEDNVSWIRLLIVQWRGTDRYQIKHQNIEKEATIIVETQKTMAHHTLIQSLSILQPSGSKFFLQISHSPGWQRRTLQCLSAGYVCTCSLVVLFTSSAALSSLSIHLLSPLVQLITTLFALPGDHLLQITLSFILYDVIGHSGTHQLLIVSYVYFFF